ncbi:MAG: flavodoxin domain-containing protein [Actinobacteria bacterium]|nr:flavodoxin domain-containing protein [Actinomycetota bacterium]
MRAVIVYESMYGNTHAIANAVAEGMRDKACDVTVLPVHRATAECGAHCDLLVVGGPTHVHTLPRPATRRSAVEAAAKPGSGLSLEPAAEGPGLREWLPALAQGDGAQAAAFDTRMEGPTLFTGQASHGIAQRLRRRGYRVIQPVQSFTVSKQNQLSAEQTERARTWGAALAFSAGPFRHDRPVADLIPVDAEQ